MRKFGEVMTLFLS